MKRALLILTSVAAGYFLRYVVAVPATVTAPTRRQLFERQAEDMVERFRHAQG